ncbi:mucoidy inhibitor A, partial [Fistulina hepatica ATCC 64428]
VNLVSLNDSVITGVSLYSSGRAEVTRAFRFTPKAGLNTVNISGLPKVMDSRSLRQAQVEGRGHVIIHDVSISTPKSRIGSTSRHESTSEEPVSKKLRELQRKKQTLSATLQHHKTATSALDQYIATLSVANAPEVKLEKVVETYVTVADKLEEKCITLQSSLADVGREIEAEKRANGKSNTDKASLSVSVILFSEQDETIELLVKYAVNNAKWNAVYSLHVSTVPDDKKSVSIVYKALINQCTGEDWSNVPLTLETATPTSGLDVPHLGTWALSIHQPRHHGHAYALAPPAVQVSRSMAPREQTSDSRSTTPEPEVTYNVMDVTSTGDVNATFQVPGTIDIPCDGCDHHVTITELRFDATVELVSVPKRDNRVFMRAKAVNASEYTFLNGEASVYVNGSFTTRSQLPTVSPQEVFYCSLGVDPSVRVTYHERQQKAAQTGVISKSRSHSYVQTISVFNTKTSVVENLKIIDQIPVSQDARISVKLLSPALLIFEAFGHAQQGSTAAVKVAQGIIARWEYTEDGPKDTIGLDGKISWNCCLQPQSKVNLQLHYEVSYPEGTQIAGL